MSGMTLAAYLKKRGCSVRELARESGVDHTAISRALSGERGLSLMSAWKLEHATGGQVAMKVWLRRQRTGDWV